MPYVFLSLCNLAASIQMLIYFQRVKPLIISDKPKTPLRLKWIRLEFMTSLFFLQWSGASVLLSLENVPSCSSEMSTFHAYVERKQFSDLTTKLL